MKGADQLLRCRCVLSDKNLLHGSYHGSQSNQRNVICTSAGRLIFASVKLPASSLNCPILGVAVVPELGELDHGFSFQAARMSCCVNQFVKQRAVVSLGGMKLRA